MNLSIAHICSLYGVHMQPICSLYGPYYMSPIIWALLYGPYYVDPIMWTLLCGPYYVDLIIWTLLYGVWTLLYGLYYMDPIIWALLYLPYYMDPIQILDGPHMLQLRQRSLLLELCKISAYIDMISLQTRTFFSDGVEHLPLL